MNTTGGLVGGDPPGSPSGPVLPISKKQNLFKRYTQLKRKTKNNK